MTTTTDINMIQRHLRAAQAASQAAKNARTASLPEAARAARALESALVAALDGEPLRGLKNIGSASVTLYGARVRAQHPDTKIPSFDELGSAVSFLCFDTRGRLIRAWWADPDDNPDADDWELHTEPIDDSELRVDDIQKMCRVLDAVLPRHVESARKNAGRYSDAQRLAVHMRAALRALQNEKEVA